MSDRDALDPQSDLERQLPPPPPPPPSNVDLILGEVVLFILITTMVVCGALALLLK